MAATVQGKRRGHHSSRDQGRAVQRVVQEQPSLQLGQVSSVSGNESEEGAHKEARTKAQGSTQPC